MSNDKKLVMIIERSNDTLEIKEDKNSDDYVFEGVFGELNVTNRNGRHYTAEQYVPQVDNLQQRIQEGSLLGELDHPDRFNVKLTKASHRIEHLEMREKDGRHLAYGRIKLLDTSEGRNAKALADDGVPLKISSRAAGVVESSGEVKLKKIFTYDLVNNPGFENAKLTRINESLGITNENLDIYELPVSYINEDEELSEIYSKEIGINNSDNNTPKKTDSNKMSNYVTEEALEKYSAHIKKEHDALTRKLDAVLESNGTAGGAKVDQLVAHNNYIVESINQLKDFVDNEIVEKSNKQFEEVNETMENVKRYSKYLANVITENAEESEGKFEKMDQLVEYAEYIAENTENLVEYSNYISENLESSIKFSDYLAENLDHSIKHTDYIAENLDNSIKHSDHIAEKINEGVSNNKFGTKFEFGSGIDKNLEQISESVDSIIDNSKKEKEASEENLPGFLELVSEDKVDDFRSYPDHVKQSLNEAFEGREVKRSSAVNRIWEEEISNHYNWEKMIPETLQPKWEALTESQKEEIRGQAESYDLTTEAKIENFWTSREFTNESLKTTRQLKREQFIHGRQINEDADQSMDKYKDTINRVKRMRGRG